MKGENRFGSSGGPGERAPLETFTLSVGVLLLGVRTFSALLSLGAGPQAWVSQDAPQQLGAVGYGVTLGQVPLLAFGWWVLLTPQPTARRQTGVVWVFTGSVLLDGVARLASDVTQGRLPDRLTLGLVLVLGVVLLALAVWSKNRTSR